MRRFVIYVLISAALFAYALSRSGDMQRSPDSTFYIAAAEYHAAGEMMRNLAHDDPNLTRLGFPSEAYYTQWAPGYSFMLAQFFRAGISWQTAARILNATALMVTGLGLLYGVREYPVWIKGVVLLALVGFPWVWDVNRYVWSELVYMAGLTWVIALMRQRHHVLLVALVCALTFLLHWRGIALVAAGVLYLFSQRKWIQGIVFGMVSSLPAGIMLAVNVVMTGSATGERLPPYYTITHLAQDYMNTLSPLVVYVGGAFCVGLILYLLQRFIVWNQFDVHVQQSERAPDALVIDPVAVHDG